VHGLRYVDVDLPTVTRRKALVLHDQPALRALLPPEAPPQQQQPGAAGVAAETAEGIPAAAAAAPAPPGPVADTAAERSGGAAGPSTSFSLEAGEVLSPGYCLVGADLRSVEQVRAALHRAGVDPSLPTLFIAECVLVYMEAQHSAPLIAWLGEHFRRAVFVNYEQVRPDDPFGRQMMQNLELRGCPLLGIMRTLEDHERRFTDSSWEHAEAVDMDKVYK
jgi:hypothetical protein